MLTEEAQKLIRVYIVADLKHELDLFDKVWCIGWWLPETAEEIMKQWTQVQRLDLICSQTAWLLDCTSLHLAEDCG